MYSNEQHLSMSNVQTMCWTATYANELSMTMTKWAKSWFTARTQAARHNCTTAIVYIARARTLRRNGTCHHTCSDLLVHAQKLAQTLSLQHGDMHNEWPTARTRWEANLRRVKSDQWPPWLWNAAEMTQMLAQGWYVNECWTSLGYQVHKCMIRYTTCLHRPVRNWNMLKLYAENRYEGDAQNLCKHWPHYYVKKKT